MATGSGPSLSSLISTASLNWQAMELSNKRKKSAAMEVSDGRKESAAMDCDFHSSIILPDDIVADILLRLPMKPLFRCNCVSKQWNSVISNPIFSRIYMQRALSSSKSLSSSPHLWKMVYPYFVRSHKILKKARASPIHEIEIEIDHTQPSSFNVSVFSLNRRSCPLNHNVVASSNGLLLSFAAFSYPSIGTEMDELEFCVSNPLTKQSVFLPSLTGPFSQWAFGLATRLPGHPGGDKIAAYFTYKVVVFIQRSEGHPVAVEGSESCTIMTFSSDTGSWRTDYKELISFLPAIFNQTFPRDHGFTRENAFTYQGILHWFDWSTRTIVTYDPYDSSCRFGCIRLPNRSGKFLENSGMNLIHLGHEDLLKFGEIENCGNKKDWMLWVWRLVDYDKGDWLLEQKWPLSVSGFGCHGWLAHINQLVAPDPWNGDLLCCLFALDNKACAVYVRSGELEVVDLCEVIVPDGRQTLPLRPVVPIALNPWSSPFHPQPLNKSSLVVRCREKFIQESILSFPLKLS